MIINEKTRQEVEAHLNTMGDFMKMHYLSECLKKNLDLDTRKFVLLKLAGIYEARNMFADSAKLFAIAADFNVTFQGKINDFLKSGELYVKGAKYYEADTIFKKAIAVANEVEKHRIKTAEKEAYKTQAKLYLKKEQRKHAISAYEKMLDLQTLDSAERAEVEKELMGLYGRVGKVREHLALKSKWGT